MEVDIIISTAIEEISSPSTLAATIGVAPISKLMLYRYHHEGNAQQQQQSVGTKMVLRCSKSTASDLRRRFSNPRPYTHGGVLTSLKFIAMRPVADVRDIPPHEDNKLLGSVTDASNKLLGCSRARSQLTSAWHSPSLQCSSTTRCYSTPSAAKSAGVQDALDLVEAHEVAGLNVPGIVELWEEFLHCATLPIDRVGRHTSRKKGKEESKDGEETVGDRGTIRRGDSEVSFDEYSKERKGRSSSEETEDYSPSCPRGECGVGFRLTPRPTTQRVRPEPQTQKNRTERGHRKQTWVEDTSLEQRHIVTEHRLRWSHRRAVACIADVASALTRINRVYSDAPRPIDLSAVVSLLTNLYANGAVFAGNRPRDMKTLDQLEVVRRYSSVQAQPSSHVLEALREPKSKRAIQRWARLLGRVMGLVQNIIDFGMFLQLYVAAAERDGAGDGGSGSDDHRQKVLLTRNNYRYHAALPHAEESNDRSFSSKWRKRCSGNAIVDSQSPPLFDVLPGAQKGITSGPAAITLPARATGDQARDPERSHKDYIISTRPQTLLWLFPACGDGGRRAFHRHAVCGGTVHGMVSVEAAAAIIWETGKVISADRIWRWCCARWERENNDGGNNKPLLCFEEFVEMCEGLKEHMIVMSAL